MVATVKLSKFYSFSVILFNFILGLSGVSTIIQVVVINVYFRGEKPVPDWMMKYIIIPLCLITFVSLPNHQRPLCCTKQVILHLFAKSKLCYLFDTNY